MGSVVLRCDASPAIGYGHVVRAGALAEVLADRGWRVAFAIAENADSAARVRERGFFVAEPPGAGESEAEWLHRIVRDRRADALVLDVKSALPRAAVAEIRAGNVIVATVDDGSDRRLAADLAFYPGVPQVARMSWTGFSGVRHSGWEWVLLRRSFATPKRRPARSGPPTVLVTMGGSDPLGLTLAAVRALETIPGDFRAEILCGPGFVPAQELSRLLQSARREYEVRGSTDDMGEVISSADLVIGSFGVTSYEVAACGVPGIYLSLSPDHAESGEAFAATGAAVSLGVHDRVSISALADAVGSLLGDREARERMGRIGRSVVDGGGVERIADAVESAVRGSRAGTGSPAVGT